MSHRTASVERMPARKLDALEPFERGRGRGWAAALTTGLGEMRTLLTSGARSRRPRSVRIRAKNLPIIASEVRNGRRKSIVVATSCKGRKANEEGQPLFEAVRPARRPPYSQPRPRTPVSAARAFDIELSPVDRDRSHAKGSDGVVDELEEDLLDLKRDDLDRHGEARSEGGGRGGRGTADGRSDEATRGLGRGRLLQGRGSRRPEEVGVEQERASKGAQGSRGRSARSSPGQHGRAGATRRGPTRQLPRTTLLEGGHRRRYGEVVIEEEAPVLKTLAACERHLCCPASRLACDDGCRPSASELVPHARSSMEAVERPAGSAKVRGRAAK